MTPELVSFVELGAAMGRKPAEVEREARELGVWITTDWSGRPAVEVNDARGLVDGSMRAGVEQQRLWQQHEAANNAWRAGRLEAGRKAAQKARAKSETRLPAGLIGGDGAVQGAAMEAAHDAMVDYEKRVKRPIWKHSGKPTAVFELIPNWGT